MAKKDKYDYFDAFEMQARLAVKVADLLVETVENFESEKGLKAMMDRAHEVEHEGDTISHSVFHRVAKDFITPIEREDIIELTQSLDNVIDLVEEVMIRFYMYDLREMHDDAFAFATLIKRSCDALYRTMGDFRNFKKSKKFKQLIIDVNSCEEDADALYLHIIRGLHTKHVEDYMYVNVWSQVFDRMERCCDACEHVADTMDSIMLRNV